MLPLASSKAAVAVKGALWRAAALVHPQLFRAVHRQAVQPPPALPASDQAKAMGPESAAGQSHQVQATKVHAGHTWPWQSQCQIGRPCCPGPCPSLRSAVAVSSLRSAAALPAPAQTEVTAERHADRKLCFPAGAQDGGRAHLGRLICKQFVDLVPSAGRYALRHGPAAGRRPELCTQILPSLYLPLLCLACVLAWLLLGSVVCRRALWLCQRAPPTLWEGVSHHSLYYESAAAFSLCLSKSSCVYKVRDDPVLAYGRKT